MNGILHKVIYKLYKPYRNLYKQRESLNVLYELYNVTYDMLPQNGKAVIFPIYTEDGVFNEDIFDIQINGMVSKSDLNKIKVIYKKYGVIMFKCDNLLCP